MEIYTEVEEDNEDMDEIITVVCGIVEMKADVVAWDASQQMAPRVFMVMGFLTCVVVDCNVVVDITVAVCQVYKF